MHLFKCICGTFVELIFMKRKKLMRLCMPTQIYFCCAPPHAESILLFTLLLRTGLRDL